ncbi:homoserine kinase [Paraneptunicella aestuarii]|uniref:homoserine kinase n=1 Tax=Paraneptunicella aestuarii TaxID=2831148 RepID=UPI001E58B6C9|nr:homoserine kinase [Paraneptunicella aestuarii]UAA39774.1 homoserine kinase [Paraneptunicella aestuarii]
MYLKVFAPASVGNVSLGFDMLGAALLPIDGSILGDEVELESSSEYVLSYAGKFKDRLPPDTQQNIVTHCYEHFIQCLDKQGVAHSPVHMTLHKHLPIGSGLGSSAASIVAALYGLNEFYGKPFDQEALLAMMGELEGQISGSIHYDNVAPSYLGGLVLIAEVNEQIAIQLPTIEEWYWVVCYSGVNVSTSAARKILPKEFSMSTTINFGRQLAVFVDALHRQDAKQALSVMHDVIAEPYRKSLLPYFDESRQFALENGAGAFGISGSGPTVFALCNELSQAEKINDWLNENYIQNEDGFSHICKLDLQGSRVVKE